MHNFGHLSVLEKDITTSGKSYRSIKEVFTQISIKPMY